MVRLKDEQKYIKKYIEDKFQFLMVRLKGTSEEGLSKNYTNFNSLWCD